MAHDKYFAEVCKPEIMAIGWHLAKQDSHDDFVRDYISHADYASSLTERLNHIIEQVIHNRYRPKHLLEIDIPKSGLAVRPGNVLPIEESSLLHAAIYALAPALDKKLSNQVYSYRLHKNWKKKAAKGRSMFKEGDIEFPFLRRATVAQFTQFEAWYSAWPEFEEASFKAATGEGFTHLTKTDISSYFENIDLRQLHDLLRSILPDKEVKILQLVFRVLEGWRRTTAAGLPIDRGIPQGNEISSFLGNLYLIPLDRALDTFCKKNDAKWFRYVDDVKVYTKNEKDARAAVFWINDALRELHLNLQGSKTRILTGDAFVREHDKTIDNRITVAQEHLDKALKKTDTKAITAALQQVSPLCKAYTQGLPEAVRGLSGDNSRHFRRLLGLYSRAGRTRKNLPEAALAAIKEMPDLRVLRSTIRYLCSLPYSKHDDIAERLFALLENNDLLFPFQIASVIEAIGQLHPEDHLATAASRIRKYALGGNLRKKNHWLVHTKALESIGNLSYTPRYYDKMTEQFLTSNHPIVRRAAASLVVRRTATEARAKSIALISHADTSIGRVGIWLRRLQKDIEYAQKEIKFFNRGDKNPRTFHLQLTLLYSISSTEEQGIAQPFKAAMNKVPVFKSRRLDWHRTQLLERVGWA